MHITWRPQKFTSRATVRLFCCAGEDIDREARKRLLAWRHLLQLLAVYQAAAPGFVDADTANDLAVIASRAFQPDGSLPEPAGATLPCRCLSATSSLGCIAACAIRAC